MSNNAHTRLSIPRPVVRAWTRHARETASAALRRAELTRAVATPPRPTPRQEVMGPGTGRFRLVPSGERPRVRAEVPPAPTPVELQDLTRKLGEVLAEARGKAHLELDEAEARLAELALAVAERIVGREIEAGRYGIAERIEEALQLARDRSDAVVHVNPVDLQTLLEGGMPEGCEFVADPEVQRGDVVVETPGGRIVSAVQEQIEAVRRGLFESRELPGTGEQQ